MYSGFLLAYKYTQVLLAKWSDSIVIQFLMKWINTPTNHRIVPSLNSIPNIIRTDDQFMQETRQITDQQQMSLRIDVLSSVLGYMEQNEL